MRLALALGLLVLSALTGQANAQSIEETYRATIENHPSLEQARLEIEIAKEQVVSARAQRRIQLSGSLSSTLQSLSTDRFFAIDVGETLINQVGIEAVLPLYTGGGLNASVDQAEHLVAASEDAYQAARQGLLLNATQAHLDVLEAGEAVRIRNENVERLSQQREAASVRFELGVGTRTDVALAEARFQAARAGLAGAEASENAASARYFELTNRAPETLVEPSIPENFPLTLEEAIDRARQTNPNLQQSRKLEDIAKYGEIVAKSQRRVRVEAFGTAGVQDGSIDNDFRDSSATLGVRATKPLYAGGGLLAAERSAILQSEQAKLQTRLIDNQLLRDMSSLWYEKIAAQTALEAARKEVEAAKVALEGAQVETDVGLRTTLDLLDQEQDLLDAELRLINAERNLYISRSRVCTLIGTLGD